MVAEDTLRQGRPAAALTRQSTTSRLAKAAAADTSAGDLDSQLARGDEAERAKVRASLLTHTLDDQNHIVISG